MLKVLLPGINVASYTDAGRCGFIFGYPGCCYKVTTTFARVNDDGSKETAPLQMSRQVADTFCYDLTLVTNSIFALLTDYSSILFSPAMLRSMVYVVYCTKTMSSRNKSISIVLCLPHVEQGIRGSARIPRSDIQPLLFKLLI